MSRSPRRPLPVLALAAALGLGGGGALVTAALSSGPAGADPGTTTTSTTTTSTTTTSTSAGAGGGSGTTLGGFTVTALAEAVTAQYEQPNLPLPANPSLEFDEGYASTTDNFGPTGTATASTFYPGSVVANAGPELSLLVPGVPLPPAPVWPAEAVSDFPQTPNNASTDEPGANMDASSSSGANTATATIGDDAPAAGAPGSQAGATPVSTGGGNPLGTTSAIFGIGESSGTSTSQAPAAKAIGTATATDSGISILNGFITIGGVTSTATATSDGTTGSVSGSTELTNVNIAGEPATIDANGISAAGGNDPAAIPVAALNTLLTELGVTLSLTNPTDTVQGASATRTLDGLKISINLDTLDAEVGKLGALLPPSLTSQFPVPLPNQQVLTLDLGTVTVSSAASPAFSEADATAGDSGLTSGGDGSSGVFTSPDSGSFDSGTGTGGTVGTGTPATPGTSAPSAPGSSSSQPTSALAPVFTGIGASLLLLGLLAALALAYAYKRVDDISELAGPACADGDPLHDLFGDADGPIDDSGGFGI